MKPAASASPLLEILRKEIENNGPMHFARFIDLALYHPEFGYYARTERTGDYYTNADVHPIFAKLIAHYFHDQWKERFAGRSVQWIELGAGVGDLAKRILDECRRFPEFYSKLRYTAVETSELRRKSAEKKLAGHSHFEARGDFDFAENSITGFIFSNEFFDALPVRRVIRQAGKLRELFINSSFIEEPAEPSAEAKDFFDALGTEPAESCKAEAQNAARRWMGRIARTLKEGLVVSIDYGLEARELLSELRPEGTLLCHYQHQTNRNFFDRLGEQDITYHVNFTSLVQEGEKKGLKRLALQTQSQFLLENGIQKMLDAVAQESDPKAKFKVSAAIKSLIHPEGMGGTFKVLVQEKAPPTIR